MKIRLLIAAGLTFVANAASAGMTYGMEKVRPSDDSSIEGAVILLGLVALVVASNSLFGGASTAMKAPVAEDDPLDTDS